MLPNTYRGPFQIAVEASHEGRAGSALIDQTNVGPPVQPVSKFKMGKKMWTLVATGVALAIVAVATGEEGQRSG